MDPQRRPRRRIIVAPPGAAFDGDEAPALDCEVHGGPPNDPTGRPHHPSMASTPLGVGIHRADRRPRGLRGMGRTSLDARASSHARRPPKYLVPVQHQAGWMVFFYFQVQRKGSPHWETLETSSLAPLRPFGYRSRLHRYLVNWQRREGAGTREMARWILTRVAELEPGAPPPLRVRIAQGWTRSSVDAPPTGRWNPPPWRRLSAQRRRVIAEYQSEELAR